jgi:hypothetical protein
MVPNIRKIVPVIMIVSAMLSLLPTGMVSAGNVTDATRGYIVLDVERDGAAWYVDPVSSNRRSLGRPDEAFAVMRGLGLGITNADLASIPTETDAWTGDLSLRARLSGRILLQVESNGEAWYVYPSNLRRYSLGRPSEALSVMSRLGLGISADDLAHIPISDEDDADGGGSATHQETNVHTERGVFLVDLVRVPMADYEMITDTADPDDCAADCGAKSLADYVAENDARIGIHGTYFCPPDYSSCAQAVNAFDPPVYNSDAARMVNESDIPYHPGPLVAYDADGAYHYYHRAKDMGSVASFENAHADLRAAIAMYPSLVENGQVVVGSETLSASQQAKSARGGIGWDDDDVLLVVAHGASVTDLASIFEALGAIYAMNLDGGASAALYMDGAYLYGPARNIPNAIVFKRR